MPKVLVLYYSFAYGHIEAMANAVAAGAREVALRLTSSACRNSCPSVAKASHYKLDQAAPVAKIDELANYDAVIVGTGRRFGRMSSPMANFLDQAGGLWMKGTLHGKAAPSPLRRASTAARRPPVFDHHQPPAFRHYPRKSIAENIAGP